jgi:VanZ family protein
MRWFFLFIVAVSTIWVLSHHPPDSKFTQWAAGYDKELHFVAYAIVGFILCKLLPNHSRLNLVIAILCLSVMDEYHQMYVGRVWEWGDLLADNLGGVSIIALDAINRKFRIFDRRKS